jgi:hypothetical protein
MSLSLANTPSSGEFEVLRALYLARGHDGNYVNPTRLLRHLGPSVTLDEVQDILEGESSTYVQASGGTYRLTTAGVARSRANKPRSSRISVA